MKNRSGVCSVLLAGAIACGSGTAVAASAGEAEQASAVRDYLARDLIFITSPALTAYLEDIAGRLLATQQNATAKPQFLIQSTSEFSLFTDIRGNIVVGSEVLRSVESEDELAAALSHELAHVIARDANAKNLLQGLPSTLEVTQTIAAGVDQRGQPLSGRAGANTGYADGNLGTTQATGVVWTDLVAPGWNRQQERDADLAGVDMARAAGYDPAAFSSLFARLDAAQARRSARVEKLRQDALKRTKSSTTAAKTGFGRALLSSAKSGAETGAAEAAFEGLANWGKDYDTPEQRTTAVLEHVKQTSSGGRRDKVPRSPRFAAELRSGPSQDLLLADQAALAVLAAVNSRQPMTGKADADRLLTGGVAAEPPSPHLNLAIGNWLESIEHRPAEAEQRSAAWIDSTLAPRAAYLWRASYQVKQRQFDQAETTLELGAERLGDRAPFLPPLIGVARDSGDMARADELGMECARSGVGANLGSATRLAELATTSGNSKPTGLYAECVAALGYDPVQRREEALQLKPAAGPAAVPGLGKSLADKLRKALGK